MTGVVCGARYCTGVENEVTKPPGDVIVKLATPLVAGGVMLYANT